MQEVRLGSGDREWETEKECGRLREREQNGKGVIKERERREGGD